MSKLIRIQSPSKVMLAFVQNWRYDLEGREECDRIIEKAVALMQNTSSSNAVEQARSWMAIDWLARKFAPEFLDLLPSLEKNAKSLRNIEQIVDYNTYIYARDKLNSAEKAAEYAARCAETTAIEADKSCRSSARSAAWSAVRSSAWSAAWSATSDAARSAAKGAAKGAAWSAGAAAWCASGASARDDAIDTARSAAGAAAWASAWAAAWYDDGNSLSSTTTFLQDSALELLERMKDIGNKIPASDRVFMNCSSEEAKKIDEYEKKAFLERLELDSFVSNNVMEDKTRRTRL
jgi:hypothetical protein